MKTTRRQAIQTLCSTLAATLTGAALLNRTFAQITGTPASAATNGPSSSPSAPTGPYTLPPLPYAYDALEPYIDAETMHLHHDKHHAAYVAKLNEAIAPYPELGAKPVEDLLRGFNTIPEPIQKAVRNQGGGHANHSLFWKILAKDEGTNPKGALAKAINDDLGGVTKFQEDFTKAAMGVFGSGWAWITIDPGTKKLLLSAAPNQDSPLMNGQTPLFGLDVWEHAYYLKYRNKRADYVKAFWSILNWDFVSDRYTECLKA